MTQDKSRTPEWVSIEQAIAERVASVPGISPEKLYTASRTSPNPEIAKDIVRLFETILESDVEELAKRDEQIADLQSKLEKAENERDRLKKVVGVDHIVECASLWEDYKALEAKLNEKEAELAKEISRQEVEPNTKLCSMCHDYLVCHYCNRVKLLDKIQELESKNSKLTKKLSHAKEALEVLADGRGIGVVFDPKKANLVGEICSEPYQQFAKETLSKLADVEKEDDK